MKDLQYLLKQTKEFLAANTMTIVVMAALLVIYLVLRLVTLTDLPIFTDEAIYLRWSQIAKDDSSWRFISLTDGKQPSFVWLTMILMRFFSDPLVAGRLVSVIAGFFTVIGLFFVTHELFKNKKTALLASGLYVIYPMALIYDRMALYESLVAVCMVWSLYFSILLVRTQRLDFAMIFGMITGAGVLTKSNAFFSIYLLPFTLLLFDWKHKKHLILLIKWLSLAAVGAGIAFMFYNILRLSPYFHMINQKNEIFVYSVSDWLQHPFRDLVSNLRGLLDWFITYYSLPFILLTGLSFFIKKAFFREKLVLLVFFLAPFVALALFGRLIYPRYIFFMTVFLLPLTAYALFVLSERIRSRAVLSLVLIAAFAVPLWTNVKIFTDFSGAPIPRLDLDQYVNEWPSGGGVREAVAFFEEKSRDRQIFIATEGTFGLMPAALELYLGKNPNIYRIMGIWPVEDPPDEILYYRTEMPTYVLFYQPCPSCEYGGDAPDDWPLKKVLEYKKSKESSLVIYEVVK